MPLRDFTTVPYLPLIDVRPAELLALDELPEKDKDLVLPLFKLRPWVGTESIEHVTTRLVRSYGTRPCFLEMGEPEFVDPEKARQVHIDLGKLRLSESGYQNWVSFFQREECRHFIPVLQLADRAEFLSQVQALGALGRGLGIRIDANRIDAGQFARFAANATDSGRDVVFVLDYSKQGSGYLSQKQAIKLQVQSILDECQNTAAIAISASSFPDGFTSITKQEIFERTLFNRLREDFQGKIVFSDRGSARAEALSGGGGLPAPRVDFAKADEWVFYRQDKDSAMSPMLSYQRQAKLLMESTDWDPKLKLWGCQMIEKTAIADETGIFSANRCTAARINIHLHQQLHYGNPSTLYDTDEEWTDF